jgi:hypothetical protein
MISFRRILVSVTAPLFVLTLAGCGGGPGLVPVTGTLKYKGTPVANAEVHLVPEDGKGRPSSGQTDASGRFKLNFDRTHEGVVAGKHRVCVKMRPNPAVPQEPGMDGPKSGLPKDLAEVFDKYSPEKSTKVVVIDTSTRELNLDLD